MQVKGIAQTSERFGRLRSDGAGVAETFVDFDGDDRPRVSRVRRSGRRGRRRLRRLFPPASASAALTMRRRMRRSVRKCWPRLLRALRPARRGRAVAFRGERDGVAESLRRGVVAIVSRECRCQPSGNQSERQHHRGIPGRSCSPDAAAAIGRDREAVARDKHLRPVWYHRGSTATIPRVTVTPVLVIPYPAKRRGLPAEAGLYQVA